MEEKKICGMTLDEAMEIFCDRHCKWPHWAANQDELDRVCSVCWLRDILRCAFPEGE